MLVRVALTLLLALPASAAVEGRQAIPGATGFGYRTLTGWPTTPTVCRVTNLNDSGAGSLVDCINADNRIVVFAVSGTIELSAPLVLDNTRVAVFGQTAPGDGIQITWASDWAASGRNTISVQGAHVVVEGLRVRNGIPEQDDGGVSCFQGDALSVTDTASDVLIANNSFAWGSDEGINVGSALSTDGPVRVTVQDNLVSEPQWNTDPVSSTCTTTAKAFLEQGEFVTVARNLFGEGARRMILLSGGGRHDYYNNFFHRAQDLDIPGAILDCDSSSNRPVQVNYLSNVWAKNSGVAVEESIWIEKQTTCPGEGCDGQQIYASGNMDWTVTDPDGSQDGLFHCRNFTLGCSASLTVDVSCTASTYRTSTEHGSNFRYGEVMHADDVETYLLSNAGAFPRDSVDTCALSGVENRDGAALATTSGAAWAPVTTGCGPMDSLTGSACTDSDTDGMCDSWEQAYWGDLDETATADGDGDGWLNIEEFAHGTHPLYNRRGGP